MKTRVVEIEIAGPTVDNETVERVMKAVTGIMGECFQNDNVAVEIREQSARTVFPEPYPMPLNPCPQKTDMPTFWWLNQPTWLAQGKGGCR